jgi:phage terminase large subunit-like protein
MRPGPKRAITAEPLDLACLPASGVERVSAFAEQFLVVPQGKGARGPFVLREWQKEIVAGLLPAEGLRPRQGVLTLPRGNGKSGLGAVLAATISLLMTLKVLRFVWSRLMSGRLALCSIGFGE